MTKTMVNDLASIGISLGLESFITKSYLLSMQLKFFADRALRCRNHDSVAVQADNKRNHFAGRLCRGKQRSLAAVSPG